MSDHRLQKWEIALLSAVAVTLLFGAALGRTPCLGWWGAIYPELSPGAGETQTVMRAAAGGGVELRFRALEWLDAALRALGIR